MRIRKGSIRQACVSPFRFQTDLSSVIPRELSRIQQDPKQALALAIPFSVRQKLPEAILAELETPISQQAKYDVQIACAMPEEHHEHHHHDVHDHNEDHDHISHHGHFDEGVLDLLICVLSETDHPVTEDERCFYLPEVHNYKANSENFKFIANFICSAVMRARADDNTGASFQIAPANGYLPPPIANSPHRGPPVIS